MVNETHTEPPGVVKKGRKSVLKPAGFGPVSALVEVSYSEMKLAAPELTADEMMLIRAYRTTQDKAQRMLLRLAVKYGEEWPRFHKGTPALSLIQGGRKT